MGNDERAIPALPARNPTVPARAPALPTRTSRSRRIGRHSSPHQLSVPPEAPALIIAVPGAATDASEEMAEAIVASASASCPGIPVQAGYLQGAEHDLGAVLTSLHEADGRAAVVVPLLACPHTQADAAVAAIAARAGFPVITAGHLGPHPLLAEALHSRLADADLARATRVGRLSMVTEADGVIVGAVGGAEAVQAVGVVAVLLASRLAIPAVPASLTDERSLREATDQLHSAQVTRVALAPCVIGPEIAPGSLDALAARAQVACARPIGAHPAVGKLVAMRYGAALEDPRIADLAV